jgi:molecular chaperone HscB
MPGDFLMQQMQWREELDEAADLPALERVDQQASNFERDTLARIEHSLDQANDPASAAAAVRMLMFVDKFLNEVHARMDAH